MTVLLPLPLLRNQGDGSRRSGSKEKKADAGPSPGGIAETVIMAARIRQPPQDKPSEDTTCGPPPGRIAAMAAQVTLKKQQEAGPPPAGGIAAMAALAAMQRRAMVQDEPESDVSTAPVPNGIAVMVAQSFLKMVNPQQDEPDSDDIVDDFPSATTAVYSYSVAYSEDDYSMADSAPNSSCDGGE